MLLHVWPDRFQKSWDGRADLDSVPCHPVMTYIDALNQEYGTDAHFCPAVLEGTEVHPRLNTKMAPEFIAAVRFYVIVLDIDGPNHECTDEWYNDQILKLRGTPWEGGIYYRTKGGYRLMWELPEALRTYEYVNLYAALSKAVKDIGIIADPVCKDWTRCYRLPYVKRDGKHERRELVIPENPMLSMALIKFSREEAKKSTIGQAVASHKLMLSEESAAGIQETNRNNQLFKLMSSLRNVAWIDESLAISFAHTLNQTRVDPPLEDNEVEHIARNVWGRYDAGTKGSEVLVALANQIEIVQKVAEKSKIICGNGELDKLVQECIAALANHPDIYVRQGKLVRVIGEQMQDLPRHALRTCLSEVADFWKVKQNEDSITEIPMDPPKDLVDCVFENGFFGPLRELEQIRTMPAIRPDGVVLNGEGYDPETKALFMPEFLVEMPAEITYEDAVAAKNRIKALYADFPFLEECHRSAAMAALMTPIMRLAIRGPTPLFLFEAPVPSAGKTLTASMAAIVATGKPPAVMAPTNEEETEKRIVTKLAAGAKIIFIDNVERPVGGPALDAALTSEWYEARLMRSHELLTLYNGATWMVTGNNVTLMGDIVRRTIRVYINPNMERPEERGAFTIPDIKKHVLEHRAEIVRDVMIMALARHMDGFVCNKHMGSFESWSYWVRETLMFLGEADCLDTQNAIKTSASVGTFGTLLTCAFQVFQPKGEHSFVSTAKFTPKDMWSVVFEGARFKGKEDHINGLISAYQELTPETTLQKCSQLLSRWSNRIINGYKMLSYPRDPIRGIEFQIVKADMEGSLGRIETASSVRESEHRSSAASGIGGSAEGLG